MTALDVSLEHRCGDSPSNALLVNLPLRPGRLMRAALLAAALLVATAAPATAGENGYFIWDSDANSWPAQGRSGSWTPPGQFSVWEHPGNMVRVKAYAPDDSDYLWIELTRHDGQRLTEGHHIDQRVLVIYRNGGPVEHHSSDQPDTTTRAKISYRR